MADELTRRLKADPSFIEAPQKSDGVILPTTRPKPQAVEPELTPEQAKLLSNLERVLGRKLGRRASPSGSEAGENLSETSYGDAIRTRREGH